MEHEMLRQEVQVDLLATLFENNTVAEDGVENIIRHLALNDSEDLD